MEDFIIAYLTDDFLHEVAAFISVCQNIAESYVSWLGLTTEEIKYQLQTLPVTYRESCSILLN